MKSLAFCFKRHVAEYLLTKQAGDTAKILGWFNDFYILYRHDTPCGSVFLVETEHDRARLGAELFDPHPRAFWISQCGNSGQMVPGDVVTSYLNYRPIDPDYEAAVQAYHASQGNSFFIDESFVALAPLI